MRAAALPLAFAALATTLGAPAWAADGPTRRFAVVAGANRGGAERVPLRYATSDARDFARVLRRLGGVALDDLTLLEEPDAGRLLGALDAVATEAGRARAEGRRVELFVYYSGHSDEAGLLLGGSRLSYAELRRVLDAIPADVRVAILDACASGAIARAKGGTHVRPFLLDASSHVSGHAFLTSSAADEAAQESDRLRASFFTHALLTGLRGAADTSGDGVVTLNEAYQFAFRETLARTETSQAGPQHATYDIQLVGSGDVVLTDLRRADAVLIVPEATDGRVFVRTAAGQLVAELRKARGTRVELALEEGRYEVRIVREDGARGATLDLAANQRLVLDEARLWPLPGEGGATRGAAAVAPRPEPSQAHAAGAPAYAAGFRAGGVASSRPRAPGGFEVDIAAGSWVTEYLGVELSAGYRRIEGQTEGRLPFVFSGYVGPVRDEITAVPARLTLKAALPTRPLRPYLLAGGGVTWARVDRFPADPGSGPAPPPQRLWDAGRYVAVDAGVGVEVRSWRRASAALELRYVFGPRPRLLQENLSMNLVSVTAGAAWTF
jgi:hypothetical protein